MRDARAALLGALAALPLALALRGFTVDDALIAARYASHLAAAEGYRFNARGAVTDGVTPLGFPFLLAPFAARGPLAALAAAKVMGGAAWILAASLLGVAIARAAATERASRGEPHPFADFRAEDRGEPASAVRSRAPLSALIILAASAPLGAFSVAGMETGLVIALSALAVALRALGFGRSGAACAGIAAGLRPELTPLSLVVAAAPSPPSPPSPPLPEAKPAPRAPRPASLATGPALARITLAMLPPLAVVAARLAIFGRPAPLAVLAKPASIELGARYALACFLLTGPVALLAPLALRRASGFARGLALAVGAHFIAIALAGGDWMPLSRLAAPALPAVALAAAHLAAVASLRATAARLALALAGEIFQLARVGPSAAAVSAERLAVIDALRPELASARVVAAVDIGWLGAATPATIVDLAGLTDPAIAALPGSHTSKAIPATLLDARAVDTLVVLLREGEPVLVPWTRSFFARRVELRIAAIPGIDVAFAPVAEAKTAHLDYLVLRRVPPPAPP
jgi:hypothetical protein